MSVCSADQLNLISLDVATPRL